MWRNSIFMKIPENDGHFNSLVGMSDFKIVISISAIELGTTFFQKQGKQLFYGQISSMM